MIRLQIKRNTTTDNAPATLHAGELAYTFAEKTLYVGSVDGSGDVSVLSDGDFVTLDTDNSSILVLEETIGGDTVTLKVPTTLANDLILKFPITREVDKLLAGSSTGQLTFESMSVATLSHLSDIDDDTTPNAGDFLKYEGSAYEWKHISSDDFKLLLGLGSGTARYTDMIVNGNLIVSGVTELDTADVIIKDKTLALGVSGGVLEGTVTSATPGGNLVIEAAALNGAEQNDLLWVDGSSITSGIYTLTTISGNTLTFDDYPSGGILDNGNSNNFVLFSADPVSDDTVDEAGIRLVGETTKDFQWNKEDSAETNPYFSLGGGDLHIDGESLFMEGIEVINAATNTLHSAIEIDAGDITTVLDGGDF